MKTDKTTPDKKLEKAGKKPAERKPRKPSARKRLSGEVDVGIISEDQGRYERILGELQAAEVAAGGELTTAEAVQLARSVAGVFTRSS